MIKHTNKQIQLPTHQSKTKFVAIAAASASCIVNQCISMSPHQVYEKVSPSVVSVTAITLERDPFEPQSLREHTSGTGTGFVFLKNNLVITNAHVIQDAFKIKIDDADAVDVNIVSIDTQHDIAILNVTSQKEPLQKCSWTPNIGDSVITIGDPYGFKKSMTMGIVSGLHRSLDSSDAKPPLVDLIQTDAPINPGNSGGPLLDANHGCVIGVNTALVSSDGSSSGLGFAIPINAVENDTHFTLGVTVLPDTYSNGLGIDGVIIADVVPGGVASSMGLVGTYRDEYGRPQIGDIIIEINKTQIKNRSDLHQVLNNINEKMKLEIVVLQKDGLKTIVRESSKN